jgi:hypothetical protein
VSIGGADLHDYLLRQGVPRYPRQDVGNFRCGVLQLLLVLAIEPEPRRDTTEPFEAHRHAGRDGGTASQDSMQRLPRDGEIPGSLADR